MKRFASAAALALIASWGASAQPVAIANGRVVTNGPDGVLAEGTVVFEDGRILAVGSDVDIPDGATTIDAEGKWVTPGLFAAFAQIGLVEVEAEGATDDRVYADDAPFSLAIPAAPAFNPAAANVGVARGDGVTRAAITTASSSSPFAGLGAIVDTSGAANSITLSPAFAGVQFDISGRGNAGGSRAAAFAYLEAVLNDAAAFLEDDEEFSGDVLSAPDAEALGRVLTGDIPLLVEADRASDLRNLAELASGYENIRLIVLGAGEAHLAADALAAAGASVIIDPSRNLPSSFDRLASTATTAAALEDAGVVFAIASLDEPAAIPGMMTQLAGLAVAYGLDWGPAFDAVTGAPARVFGLDEDLGSLEPGKLADVLIWDGDPLEVMSGVERVFIGGVEADTRSRQSDLRDRYLTPRAPGEPPYAYRRP